MMRFSGIENMDDKEKLIEQIATRIRLAKSVDIKLTLGHLHVDNGEMITGCVYTGFDTMTLRFTPNGSPADPVPLTANYTPEQSDAIKRILSDPNGGYSVPNPDMRRAADIEPYIGLHGDQR